MTTRLLFRSPEVAPGSAITDLYPIAEVALEGISPITLVHHAPPGRYYKLRDDGDYCLVDLRQYFPSGPPYIRKIA